MLNSSFSADFHIFFSYSEWWRYIGPVKPRQPLRRKLKEGACLSESLCSAEGARHVDAEETIEQ